LKSLPLALTLARLLLGLALPLLAILRVPPPWLAGLFLAGFLTDVFDGVCARRLGVSTLALRRLDSRCDIVFLAGAISAVWIGGHVALADWAPWLWAYGILFLARNAIDFIRYRASPSYHMWSGRIWALLVGIYLFLALLGQAPAFLIPLAFAAYAINAIEGIIATLLLPSPMADIPTLWHVMRRRRAGS
jgi:CDP-diacylglycerol--glycerol-3-phosphate 3-phosphatidyltransferase